MSEKKLAPDWHKIGTDWHGLTKIGTDWQGLANWKIIGETESWPLIGNGLARDWFKIGFLGLASDWLRIGQLASDWHWIG